MTGHSGSGDAPQAPRDAAQRTTIKTPHKEIARAEIVLNSMTEAVISTDMSGNIDYLNSAAENITGWSRTEAQGRPISEVFKIINGVTREPDHNPVELVLRQDEPMGVQSHTVLVRRDGSEAPIEDSASPVHDPGGKIDGAVVVFHDVSAALAMTLKMAHLAQHDVLTDLPNRALLNDRLTQAIRLATEHGARLATLFLDLDNFRHINNSLGHETGDRVLQSVAQRLNAAVRNSDTVSRQGGDEFLILLAEIRSEDDAALTADRIIDALKSPHSIGGREVHVSASIGISIYPADGQDAETLIKNADAAVYHAKNKGRNNYQFFRNDMNVRAVERHFIESSLRRALDKGEFELHYQPIVNLDTGIITGAEGLLRWIDMEQGTVLPARFVPIAEDSSLIVPIGRWVLREACAQAKRWMDAGLPPVSMGVNVSTVEFSQKDFVEGIRAVLSETGLEARYLQLEITESVLMRDAESSAAVLKDLKTIGVQLALDDFGTGYSSLSYLQQFPVDVIKIDQSFINEIVSPNDDGVIIGAVIGMGNSLKKRVVAEGVEQKVQLEFLKARHCDEGQGYLFSRPVIAEQFATLLATGPYETGFERRTRANKVRAGGSAGKQSQTGS